MSRAPRPTGIYYLDTQHNVAHACMSDQLLVIDWDSLTEDEARQIDAYPDDLPAVLRAVCIRSGLINPDILP
jgi:hypothetical protein